MTIWTFVLNHSGSSSSRSNSADARDGRPVVAYALLPWCFDAMRCLRITADVLWIFLFEMTK